MWRSHLVRLLSRSMEDAVGEKCVSAVYNVAELCDTQRNTQVVEIGGQGVLRWTPCILLWCQFVRPTSARWDIGRVNGGDGKRVGMTDVATDHRRGRLTARGARVISLCNTVRVAASVVKFKRASFVVCEVEIRNVPLTLVPVKFVRVDEAVHSRFQLVFGGFALLR